ncbi:hypothetical protein P691DRAFT_793660 [Macrolepiota fuliginosa MF-IS2]|uniref:Tc1-like transposase DDE domain-containing protein n=1 Tax=Macrolepiota fuliginosa MF-IS2 TaxID=1400762 RepID=A0A9P5WXK0_9AGAR|nr:hypothetical protein P691DRAFT_793660 [Macrolepiota fuliginosa MF-IS2]
MVADFFSAEYGWLQSPDGKESTYGYFDNNSIQQQSEMAMDVLTRHYPDEDHVFIFDNAQTHSKQADDALSALWMTKNPSANFGVEVIDIGPDGKPHYAPDGKVVKKKVWMANGHFTDGSEQESYFPEGHKMAGQFKGIAQILTEWGFLEAHKMKLQCKSSFSSCPVGKTACCCHQLLFSQPDFVQVDSILENEVKSHGFTVIFLPKFHCELNPIEQCWGYAKQCYCLYPASSSEEDLEKNVVSCLDNVPLLSM